MAKHYQPRKYAYPEFEDSFRALLRDAEAAADAGKHAPAQRKQPATNGVAVSRLTCRLRPVPNCYWSGHALTSPNEVSY